MTETLALLAASSGIASSFFMFPQVYKIYKRKSAKDISILAFGMILVSCIVWVFYGLQLGDLPIIITNALTSVFLALIVIGWFLYGWEKKGHHKKVK